MRDKLIYYINFILIFILIPIKIIDFSMSLEYIGTNNICESNPFGYLFLDNPLIMFIIFLGMILFWFIINIIIHKKCSELASLLLLILVLMNFIGFYILINNFIILGKVNNL